MFNSCELLSNYCIFDIWNNLYFVHIFHNLVVNCFQIIVSLTSETTFAKRSYTLYSLWIAFKLLYLWHLKQLATSTINVVLSCELLSNYCIFDIWNNEKIPSTLWRMLWIAFKLLYLWHLKQLGDMEPSNKFRCELLSNYCIFDIWNN